MDSGDLLLLVALVILGLLGLAYVIFVLGNGGKQYPPAIVDPVKRVVSTSTISIPAVPQVTKGVASSHLLFGKRRR